MTEPSERLSLLDVAEVAHVSDVDRVNRYLAAGWRVLATFTSEYAPNSTVLTYALGWPRARGDAHHPTYDPLEEFRLEEE